MPLAESNLSIIAATADAGRTALLLSATDSIWKSIVRADVIKLRRWLVVPTAPGLPTIDGDDCALIAAQQNDVRVVRIDPDVLIIVAARRAAQSRPSLAAIG